MGSVNITKENKNLLLNYFVREKEIGRIQQFADLSCKSSS